ncbi:MerR family transcriptional regulator [Micromonospora sp. CA-263727]|uniref:MerR family transcriptional regulator n=1 Tax=Micromonospora sp. CA-263727 TaxID=3239967 RepID=UPI003D91DE03
MAGVIREGAMRIGELARRSGVSVRSLRYYEEQSLLASERTTGGQRIYPDTAVERVRWIQRLYEAGLPSRTVAELLPCVFAPDTVSARDMLDRLTAERDRIDARATELLATRDKLDAMITSARTFFSGAGASA